MCLWLFCFWHICSIIWWNTTTQNPVSELAAQKGKIDWGFPLDTTALHADFFLSRWVYGWVYKVGNQATGYRPVERMVLVILGNIRVCLGLNIPEPSAGLQIYGTGGTEWKSPTIKIYDSRQSGVIKTGDTGSLKIWLGSGDGRFV